MTEEVIVQENDVITVDIARMIERIVASERIMVRSPLTCEAPIGICARCYGMDLSRSQLAEPGLAVGIIAAAHRSYSGCTQYRENVVEARKALAAAGVPDVKVTYVSDWHDHPSFIAANAEHVVEAVQQLPEAFRPNARLIFTAHSIPLPMAQRYPYREQFEETARLVAAAVQPAPASVATVYQSRSGRPEDPWLGPDIGDHLREACAGGVEAAVIVPIGFVCDHVEVLYDLDVEAADIAREIGLPMARARAVNDHPRFLDMMADVVLRTERRYANKRPLELVAT